jgi:putative SOS response-associated peptidase YedK
MDTRVYQLLESFVAEATPGPLAGRPPRYNIAPTQDVPVLRERHGEREIADVRWGMVTPGSPTFGGGKPVYNARIETVHTLGLFRNPFLKSRCIVFATGYYEWEQQASGKQPYFIHDPDGPLAMAGIVRAWADPARAAGDPDRWRLSMSIITRDTNVAPGLVHDRMPAALRPDSIDDWLGDHQGAEALLGLLDRDSLGIAQELECYAVDPTVNRVEISKGVPNDGPELIRPLR